jgi:hypothetical protein
MADSWQVQEIFLFNKMPGLAVEPTQPFSQCVLGAPALDPRVKRSGHETDCSPPLSAKIKNEWRYSSTPSLWLHGVHTGTITLTCNTHTIQVQHCSQVHNTRPTTFPILLLRYSYYNITLNVQYHRPTKCTLYCTLNV